MTDEERNLIRDWNNYDQAKQREFLQENNYNSETDDLLSFLKKFFLGQVQKMYLYTRVQKLQGLFRVISNDPE